MPDSIAVNATPENKASDLKPNDTIPIKNILPIHGPLDQKQIDQYYKNILDTIRDKSSIGAEPIDIYTNSSIHVSLLHNTGTFDQMFLCTHDKYFKLLDTYYIGKATMFDETSHTIEYKKIDRNSLQFQHVDWGWVTRNNEQEIDTTNYYNYILTIRESGKIIKE